MPMFFLTFMLLGQQRGFKSVKVPGTGTDVLYEQSYALVIGESEYNSGWNKLTEVKQDVSEVKKVLEKHDFQVVLKENIVSDDFDQTIKNFIADYGQTQNSRVLIYYAGHGHTILNATSKEQMGYLVPVDAPHPLSNRTDFLKKAVSIERFEDYSKRFEAKHVLFVFDACFAGTIFSSRSGGGTPTISGLTAKPVRQFITSGSAEETVPAESYFRKVFVQALESDVADATKDGFLTATELAIHLQNEVTNFGAGTQHPQYGKIRNPNLNEGDFVFELSKIPNEPEPGGFVQGKVEIEYKYGDILIDTEIGGKLYLDGIYMGEIQANTKENKLVKQLVGIHKIKIVGDETFKEEIVVYPNQVAHLEAKKTDFTISGNSNRKHKVPKIFEGNPFFDIADNYDANAFRKINILNLPETYAHPPKAMPIDNYPIKHNSSSVDQNWIVYSDRNNNITYLEPGLNSYKTASFLQKFYVIEEKDDYLHIIEDITNPIDIKLSEKAIDYGWIHKDNLVLYRASLKNMENVYLKAISKSYEYNKINIAFNPNFSDKNQINAEQLYFIYKKVGTSLLLGKSYETRGNIFENLIGWFHEDNLEIWRNKLAFEPNWDEHAYTERKQKGISAKVFSTIGDCEKYLNGNLSIKGVWDKDPIKNLNTTANYMRDNAYAMRFPFTSLVNDSIAEVMLIKNINSNFSTNKGYLPLKQSSLENYLFKPVILLSRLELYQLQMIFDKLGNIINLQSNERRKQCNDLWQEILTSYVGGNDYYHPEQFANENLADLIYGAGISSIVPSMLSISINCLNDPECINDRDFNMYLSILRSKSHYIQSILKSDDDPRSFLSSGIIYYWLDFDVLP